MLYPIRKFLSQLAIAIALLVLLSFSPNHFTIQAAGASIRQMEEAPGQVLIQSRHTLKDKQRNAWQVVLFRRSQADGSSLIHLRLVDFPGIADFDHPQPLTINTSAGDLFQAEDIFAQKAPAANVGEFDLKNILPQLPVTKLNLALAMKGDRAIATSIPPDIVLEWQNVAAQS